MEYWYAITNVEAHEMLMAMKISDYPHLKKEDRSRTMKEIRKMAQVEEPAQISNKQLAVALQGMLDGR